MDFMRWNDFFISSIYSLVVRLNACHTKMHYSIYLLFHYLSVYLHIYLRTQKGIYECEKVSVAVWEEKISERLEPIGSQGLRNLKFNVRPGGIGLFFYNIDTFNYCTFGLNGPPPLNGPMALAMPVDKWDHL